MKRYEKMKRILPPPRLHKERDTERDYGIVGFDTETVPSGKAFILAASDESNVWKGDSRKYVRFIHEKLSRTSYGVFFNLRFDTSAVLHDISKEDLWKIHLLGECDLGDYHIKVIPGKYLEIARSGFHTAKCYDVAQFFHMSLKEVAKKYLGDVKLEEDVTSYSDLSTLEPRKPEIRKYCIQDAVLARKAALFLQKTYRDDFGVPFNAPYSPAYMSSVYFRKFSLPPTYRLTGTLEPFWMSYYGGRFEVFRKGHFDQVSVIDLNSAYPYWIARLPNFGHGRYSWVFTEDDLTEWGAVKVRIEEKSDWIGALPCRLKGLLVFPRTSGSRWITTYEYKWLQEHGYHPHFLVGFIWTPNSEITFPYAHIVDLYRKRKEQKLARDPRELVTKIMMNSLYGKFIQLTPKVEALPEGPLTLSKIIGLERDYKSGLWFNPLAAAIITARTRLQVTEKALEYGDRTIAIATDSVTVKGEAYEDSQALGEWKLESRGEAIVLGSGRYSIRNEKGLKTSFRGVPRASNYDLFDIAAKDPHGSVVEVSNSAPIKIASYLVGMASRPDRTLNSWVRLEKAISINFDKKRLWERPFTDWEDAASHEISSKTLDVGAYDIFEEHALKEDAIELPWENAPEIEDEDALGTPLDSD